VRSRIQPHFACLRSLLPSSLSSDQRGFQFPNSLASLATRLIGFRFTPLFASIPSSTRPWCPISAAVASSPLASQHGATLLHQIFEPTDYSGYALIKFSHSPRHRIRGSRLAACPSDIRTPPTCRSQHQHPSSPFCYHLHGVVLSPSYGVLCIVNSCLLFCGDGS
jgi:hypothetical protein